MPAFTKKVSITYSSTEDQVGSPEKLFTSARFTKTSEMVTAEKTNGVVTVTQPATSSIKFVDQASAQEYLDYILTIADENNIAIVASSITDI